MHIPDCRSLPTGKYSENFEDKNIPTAIPSSQFPSMHATSGI